MRKLSAVLSLVILLSVATVLLGRSYTAPFSVVENPVSESGNWISGHAGSTSTACNGGTTYCWGDMKVIAGNLLVGNDEPTTYGDPTAILSGTWGDNQDVTLTLRTNGVQTGCCKESEIRLRSALGVQRGTCSNTNCNTGYEILCDMSDSGYALQVVKWFGPNGIQGVGFDYLDSGGTACVNGDVLRATISGTGAATRIHVYKNGTEVSFGTYGTAGVQDPNVGGFAPYTGGAPGAAVYDTTQTAPFTGWNVGVSNFSATDGAGNTYPKYSGGRTWGSGKLN